MELALCRVPTEKEVQALTEMYQTQLKYFQENPDEAAAFQRIGQFAVAEDVDEIELAALAQVCRVVLNLHETITRY